MAGVSFGPSEGDWFEDFEHANGHYMCICSTCGNSFIGHKRRLTCKVCADKELKERALNHERVAETLKLPVTYNVHGGDILNKENEKVLDLRGWGYIQHLSDPEVRQDEVGQFVADAINWYNAFLLLKENEDK